MKDVKVSIIINNYNYAAYLDTCINSAINQTYPHLEVVVVDDGSSDTSHEIMHSFSDQVKCIFQDNAGQASAFNVGFSECAGDIICFLDADDVFQENKVSKVVQYFLKNPEVEWFFHTLAYVDSVGAPHAYQNPHQTIPSSIWDLRTQIAAAQPLPFVPTATSGMCFSRSLLEKLLPMPEKIRITSDNYLKFAALALSKGFFESTSLAYQRLHDSNSYTNREDIPELRAKTAVSIAYALRMRFANLEKFADGLFVLGLGMYVRTGIFSPQIWLDIRCYFRGMNFFRRVNILLRVISCVLKNPENIKWRRVKYG